jgi:hypothetical protein
MRETALVTATSRHVGRRNILYRLELVLPAAKSLHWLIIPLQRTDRKTGCLHICRRGHDKFRGYRESIVTLESSFLCDGAE